MTPCTRGWRIVGVFLALLAVEWSRGAPPAGAIEEVDVPLDHWAYEFLERLELRARLDRTGLEDRPLTRGHVARLVERLREARRRGTWTPSPVEARQLGMLAAAFSEERADQGASTPVLDRAWHAWRGEGWQFQILYGLRQRIERGVPDRNTERAQLDLRLVLEPELALRLGEFVAFERVRYRLRTSDGPLRNSTDPRHGEAELVFDPRDRFSIQRSTDALLRWRRGPVRVDLGRDVLRWGPGRQQTLLLGADVPPYDRLRLRLDFGWVRFTSTSAQLRPGRLRADDPDLGQKYLAAHRLVFEPSRHLVLGVSEAVVYGDRGLDLGYVNPLTVLFVTQANNGDRDNALAGFDATVRLADAKVYTEWVIDDLNLRRGLSHFGNKVAGLVGFLWLQPFGRRDWDLDGEWAYVSQFTYTHQIPINRFQHFGVPLGSRIGTDADAWTFGVRRRWQRGWSARAFYGLERHGEGDLAIDQEQRTSDRQEYLSGVVESRHTPGLEVEYRGLRSLDWRARYRYLWVVHPANREAAGPLRDHEWVVESRWQF